MFIPICSNPPLFKAHKKAPIVIPAYICMTSQPLLPCPKLLYGSRVPPSPPIVPPTSMCSCT